MAIFQFILIFPFKLILRIVELKIFFLRIKKLNGERFFMMKVFQNIERSAIREERTVDFFFVAAFVAQKLLFGRRSFSRIATGCFVKTISNILTFFRYVRCRARLKGVYKYLDRNNVA